jgi:hypothetical protein
MRVGQAVDVVAQAGKPRTITGFQTHTTPVLLGYGERAELADEEYVPQTPILEGIVILKKVADGDGMEHDGGGKKMAADKKKTTKVVENVEKMEH